MGKIFCVMGKSSSGKDTIYKELKEIYKEFLPITMYTTRPIRNGETEGIEYHFVSKEKFEKMYSDNKVIEYRTYDTVHGPWTYFTADDGQINLKEENYLVIGTLKSYQSIREYFGEDKVTGIYIEIDDGVRLSRALKREMKEENPKYEEMCRRFLADQEDFSEENLKACSIEKRFVNNDLKECIEEIKSFIDEQIILL